ncbi:MAG: nitroreductase family protein [Arachnia sp.]
MTSTTLHTKAAETSVPLHTPLAERWSPRAFSATHQLREEEVTGLLEAARWAPSASNTQPWRFLVAHRDGADFDLIAEQLAAGNRVWAGNASILVLAAARQSDDNGNPLPWALYDTGQAVSALTIQAQTQGLIVHQMGGFDADGISKAFNLDATVTPVVVFAVGQHDPTAELPEKLAERETMPRHRLPLESLLIQTALTGHRAA